MIEKKQIEVLDNLVITNEDIVGSIPVVEAEEIEDPGSDVEEIITPEKIEKKEEKKEEIEKSSAILDIAKHFIDQGILFGNIEEVDDSDEGLEALVQNTIEKSIESYKDSFKDPRIKDFMTFLENGGDPQVYVQAVARKDYSKISEDSLEGDSDKAVKAQKQLLLEFYVRRGDDPQEAEIDIEAFADTGKLEKKALTALKKMQEADKLEYKSTLDRQLKEEAARIEKNETLLADLKTTIDSSESIGGFELTKREKTELFDYMTKVDPETGKTPLWRDSMDPKKKLQMAYYYFKGFNFDEVDKKVKKKATLDLASKLGRYSDTKPSGTKARKKEESQEDGINMDVLKKALKI